jgi:hypothetical protein
MESNYPDWCTGRERLRTIDKIEEEYLSAVVREDVQSEIRVLEEKLVSLRELLGLLEGRRCDNERF